MVCTPLAMLKWVQAPGKIWCWLVLDEKIKCIAYLVIRDLQTKDFCPFEFGWLFAVQTHQCKHVLQNTELDLSSVFSRWGGCMCVILAASGQ